MHVIGLEAYHFLRWSCYATKYILGLLVGDLEGLVDPLESSIILLSLISHHGQVWLFQAS